MQTFYCITRKRVLILTYVMRKPKRKIRKSDGKRTVNFMTYISLNV